MILYFLVHMCAWYFHILFIYLLSDEGIWDHLQRRDFLNDFVVIMLICLEIKPCRLQRKCVLQHYKHSTSTDARWWKLLWSSYGSRHLQIRSVWRRHMHCRHDLQNGPKLLCFQSESKELMLAWRLNARLQLRTIWTVRDGCSKWHALISIPESPLFVRAALKER